MTPHIVQILGLIFGREKWGNWTSFLHGNCSYIGEIDVRLLNHRNWTSITRVMVHFFGTATSYPVLTPYTVQILGLIFGWEKERIWTNVLHGNYSWICKLDVDF